MFKYPLGDSASIENNTHIGLTTTILSKSLTMHLNDSSSIYLHFKSHSIPKYKFRKILVENTPIIAHIINKLQVQILEARHKKNRKQKT